MPCESTDEALKTVCELVQSIYSHMYKAQDNLLAAKITQAHYANEYQDEDSHFKVGDKVWLNTANWRRDYIQKGSGRVTKFMPCYDSPFEITKAQPETSLYMLALSPSIKIHPTFHISQLKPLIPNDDASYPSYC